MIKSKNILFCALIFLPLFLFLVLPPLSSFFSQDDFHHLRTIMDKSWSDIPSFFVTWQEGQTFYRPLSREIFNLSMYKTFGLNPLPFHIVNFLQILIIALLTYILVIKITKQQVIAWLAVFFYLMTPVHNIELYYLASVQPLFATIFLLISLIYYFSFNQKFNLRFYFFSVLFFVLALLSHPMAVSFPFLLVLVTLFTKKSVAALFTKQFIYLVAPFMFFDIFYIVFSSLFNLPQQEVYQPVFSFKAIINTLYWYVLWSFGLPEMLVDFIGPGFHVNPNLIKWYKDYLTVTLPLLGFFILSLILILVKSWKVFKKELYPILFMGAFVISLSTFLIFPQHKFISYMSLAVVWTASAIAYLLSKLWKEGLGFKVWVILLMGSFFIISWQTSKLNTKTHWAAKRAVAAQYLLTNIKNNYPTVDKGAVFYFKNDLNYPQIAKDWGTSSKQAFYILSGADGLKLLYGHSSITAYFEDIKKPPKENSGTQFIEYIAKFPY